MLATTVATVATVAALAVGPPSLQLVSPSPVVVRGQHFQGREIVTVTLRVARQLLVRHVRADAAGTFTAAFRGRLLDRCAGYVVRALGAGGSRAVLRSPPVLCPPRSPPGPPKRGGR